MAIFHCYVSSPEGMTCMSCGPPDDMHIIYLCSLWDLWGNAMRNWGTKFLMKLGMHPAWTSWPRAGAATVPVGSTGSLFQVAVEMSMNSMSETQYIQYSITILGVCESLRCGRLLGCLAAGLLLPFASAPACLAATVRSTSKHLNWKNSGSGGVVGMGNFIGCPIGSFMVDSYIPKWPTLKPFQRSSSGWNLKAAPLHSFVGRRTAHFGSSGIGSSQCLCPSDLTAGIHQVVVAKIHKGLPTNRPA